MPLAQFQTKYVVGDRDLLLPAHCGSALLADQNFASSFHNNNRTRTNRGVSRFPWERIRANIDPLEPT